jgi:hypothetical protein
LSSIDRSFLPPSLSIAIAITISIAVTVTCHRHFIHSLYRLLIPPSLAPSSLISSLPLSRSPATPLRLCLLSLSLPLRSFPPCCCCESRCLAAFAVSLSPEPRPSRPLHQPRRQRPLHQPRRQRPLHQPWRQLLDEPRSRRQSSAKTRGKLPKRPRRSSRPGRHGNTRQFRMNGRYVPFLSLIGPRELTELACRHGVLPGSGMTATWSGRKRCAFS